MPTPAEPESPPSRPSSAENVSAPLTARIAAGDEEAFAAFYELWFDRAVGLARAATRRDESFCFDVVQSTMLKVVRSLPVLQSDLQVEQWMGRALFTTSLDLLRAERRRRQKEVRGAEERSESIAPDPVATAEQAERASWLADRLAELPPVERELIVRRYRDDETLRAAGAQLGMTPFAAHGRIRRVLERWRRRWPQTDPAS